MAAVLLTCREGLVALAGAGGVDVSAGCAELAPGGPASTSTVNVMMKATATAASVNRGLRCFTAPPPPDGYACWG